MDESEIIQNNREHQAIMKRLTEEEKAHARILYRLQELETKLDPLIELAPFLDDLAGAGRIGRWLGKFVIGLAALVAAIAGIIYAISHGFHGKP